MLAFGETVADASLTAMKADEAQAFADSGLTRWAGVATAQRELEGGGQQGQPNRAPTVSAAICRRHHRQPERDPDGLPVRGLRRRRRVDRKRPFL